MPLSIQNIFISNCRKIANSKAVKMSISSNTPIVFTIYYKPQQAEIMGVYQRSGIRIAAE